MSVFSYILLAIIIALNPLEHGLDVFHEDLINLCLYNAFAIVFNEKFNAPFMVIGRVSRFGLSLVFKNFGEPALCICHRGASAFMGWCGWGHGRFVAGYALALASSFSRLAAGLTGAAVASAASL